MMRFGFVMTSAPYRREILERSMRSLSQTRTSEFEKKPILMLVHKEATVYQRYVEMLNRNWEVREENDIPNPNPESKNVCNYLFSHFGDKLLRESDVSHIGFLVDDFIYNPNWLTQLKGLIERRPDGIAWSVYRSRYTDFHRIIDWVGTDCLMTMHDCVGTMTRQEWETFGASKVKDFNLGGHYGDSIDIYHAHKRQGNRWATGRDYMNNLDRHTDIKDFDCAIDFIGEW